MNEVAKQQKVIVTRVGVFWVDLDRAQSIDAIRQSDPNAIIDIDGSMISASQIYATLTPSQYSNYQMEKRGMWQCQWQKWHSKFDTCEHARELHREPPKVVIEQTPEQRAAASAKLAEIRKQIKEKGIGGLNK